MRTAMIASIVSLVVTAAWIVSMSVGVSCVLYVLTRL